MCRAVAPGKFPELVERSVDESEFAVVVARSHGADHVHARVPTRTSDGAGVLYQLAPEPAVLCRGALRVDARGEPLHVDLADHRFANGHGQRIAVTVQCAGKRKR